MTEIREFARLARLSNETELRIALHSARAIVEEYETARATIRELKKRIGELEAERDHNSTLWKQTLQKYRKEFERAETAEQALTAERQRREELERELGKCQKAT